MVVTVRNPDNRRSSLAAMNFTAIISRTRCCVVDRPPQKVGKSRVRALSVYCAVVAVGRSHDLKCYATGYVCDPRAQSHPAASPELLAHSTPALRRRESLGERERWDGHGPLGRTPTFYR